MKIVTKIAVTCTLLCAFSQAFSQINSLNKAIQKGLTEISDCNAARIKDIDDKIALVNAAKDKYKDYSVATELNTIYGQLALLKAGKKPESLADCQAASKKVNDQMTIATGLKLSYKGLVEAGQCIDTLLKTIDSTTTELSGLVTELPRAQRSLTINLNEVQKTVIKRPNQAKNAVGVADCNIVGDWLKKDIDGLGEKIKIAKCIISTQTQLVGSFNAFKALDDASKLKWDAEYTKTNTLLTKENEKSSLTLAACQTNLTKAEEFKKSAATWK
jgi:mRNA-degrading endonuclease HigB of HigAB toxin-antitoxin module